MGNYFYFMRIFIKFHHLSCLRLSSVSPLLQLSRPMLLVQLWPTSLSLAFPKQPGWGWCWVGLPWHLDFWHKQWVSRVGRHWAAFPLLLSGPAHGKVWKCPCGHATNVARMCTLGMLLLLHLQKEQVFCHDGELAVACTTFCLLERHGHTESNEWLIKTLTL